MTDHYAIDPNHRPMRTLLDREAEEIIDLKRDVYILTQENKILKEKLLEFDPSIDIEKLLY